MSHFSFAKKTPQSWGKVYWWSNAFWTKSFVKGNDRFSFVLVKSVENIGLMNWFRQSKQLNLSLPLTKDFNWNILGHQWTFSHPPSLFLLSAHFCCNNHAQNSYLCHLIETTVPQLLLAKFHYLTLSLIKDVLDVPRKVCLHFCWHIHWSAKTWSIFKKRHHQVAFLLPFHSFNKLLFSIEGIFKYWRTPSISN